MSHEMKPFPLDHPSNAIAQHNCLDCKIDHNVLPKIGLFGLLKEIAKKARPYLYFSVSILAYAMLTLASVYNMLK